MEGRERALGQRLIATKRMEQGPVLTLYGLVEGEATLLCLEQLAPVGASHSTCDWS